MRNRKIFNFTADESVKGSSNISVKIATLFLPDSRVRIAWDVFIFFVIWYNSVITPIRIFIMSGDSTPQLLISLDIVFDFIFVADTILRFYRPYVDENTGQIVMDQHLIRMKYRGSFTFYINAIACIPIIKLPLSPFLSVEQMTAMHTYFNVLRMIRVLHLPEQFQELKRFRERKGPVNEPVFRMYVILFFMLLFMCECGCLYFGLSTLLVVDDICPHPEDFVDDVLGEEMWVAGDSVITNVMDTRVCEADPSIECEDCPQTMFFMRSIYFLMQTIFTIGYGDSVVPSKSSVEMALACAFMIFGVFAYGMTIANMTSVLANLDVVNMQFRHEMDTISRWLSLRSVPTKLRQRLTMYFSYLSRSQHGMMDEILLRELPPRLSIELAERHLDLLNKVPFFRKEKRDEGFLSLVATSLKRRIYTPGTFILYQGEIQREMLIIKSGKAEIILAGVPESVGSLLPGDYIGDYQLIFGTINQVGVCTSEFSEGLVLTFDAFKQVMDHPQNKSFSFALMDYTFRRSNDEGSLETIKTTKESLNKILNMASIILSGKNRSKLKNMMSENETTTKEFRILPNSRLHLYWDLFSIAAILYYSIDSPIRIASHLRANTLSSSYDHGFIIGYFFDLLFIADMILRANAYSYTVYANGTTVVVSDRAEIRRRYLLSKKFKIDLLAVLPLDFIYIGIARYHAMFRLSKLIRVVQIPQVISNLQEHLDACMDVKMNETQRSILLMLLYSILLIVWSSAGWNALRPDELAIVSLYWAITTLSTVGYGDVTPTDFNETCYALFVGAVGAVFTAAVVANVTSFFHATELTENNYEHKLNCVKRFMDRHKTPHDRAQSVSEYFDYIDREQDGLNEGVLLIDAIPDHISKNLLVHITQPMVGECEFFADCESGFIRKIMVSMEQLFFGALYDIMTNDVVADSMYFIKKGRVDLMAENTDKSLRVIRKLDANDSFAEGCLVEHWEKNPFVAKTASECEVWVLKRTVFQKILAEFPRSRSLLGQIVSTKNDDERRRASVHNALKAAEKARQKSAVYIHPHSYFMQAWFGLILNVTMYSMIAVPFRVAFLENHEISISWLLVDYFGDILFFADFVFRAAFLAFYDENNNLVVKHRDIWTRYVKSGKVKWHIVSALPIEAAVLLFPSLCPLWKLQTWSLFRLNKLLRAIEMPYLIRRVESSLAKAGIKVPKNPLKVLKLLLVILLLAHINSCVFFAMANFNQHANSGDANGQLNWANSEGLFDPSPTCPGYAVPFEAVSRQYTAALYWAMATISTVGYGDITAHLSSTQEILYSTLILLVGMSVYTLVIASLEDIVAQLDVTSSLYKLKTDKVNTYAQIQCLPESLKAKITAYYEQLWRSHLGVKGDKLLNYIPTFLKLDLVADMTSPFIRNTFFIKDCATDFVSHIVHGLDLEIYLPDDYLFREGERCDVLYFAYSGAIDLLTAQNVKFKTVSNCALGESSFFLFEPHICTAKAVDSCEIFQLSMDSFLRSISDHQLHNKFKDHLAVHHPALLEAKASIEKTIQNLSSSKMVRFLDANEGQIKVPKGVILPDSKIRVAWDLCAIFGVLYLIISIPIKISFIRASVGIASFLVDVLVDAFFMVDVYSRLRKFAVVKDGFMITSRKDFRKIYLQEEFELDFVSVLPLSTVAYIIGLQSRQYGLLRLFQFVRVVRIGKYLDGLVEYVNTRTRFVVTTASLRVCQIFMIILFLCHWFSCTFHFIGTIETSQESWIISDEMQHEELGRRYLRSFYWALYTMTTIGYGSVPVVTIPERAFAMVAMAVGAVICDAGLTAVLASIIANKDHQAGTNNRRIQCSKLFMKTNNVEENLQQRILDYYAYADGEMRNIDENDVINDLSSPLRSEILLYFCFNPLRECAYFDEYSDGAIFTLVKTMISYIAVPGEHLSEIGKECHSIFVFQKGSVRTKDTTGSMTNVLEGAIIGHLATLSIFKKEGPPTHGLKLELLSANFPKVKNGNPYIIVKNGMSRCRSSVKRSRNWMEMIETKVKVGNGKSHKTEIIVKDWRKRQNHVVIGCGEIVISESSSGKTDICSIFDEKGKKVGSIQLRAQLSALSEAESLTSHELTSTALGFSHFYRLDVTHENSLKNYVHRSIRANIVDRIPMPNGIQDKNAEVESGCLTYERRTEGTTSIPIHMQSNEQAEQDSSNEPSHTSYNENNVCNNDFDWDYPIVLTPAPVTQANNERERRSVFFAEWAENGDD